MQEHRTGERKKERSIKHHVVMLMPFPSEEPLRPRTNPSSTQKKLSEGTWPRPEHSPQKGDGSGKLLDPRPAEPEWNSEAGAEPERSPSGARTEHRTPKGARDSERTLGVPKLHYSENAESPVIPGRPNAPQAHQTLISLPIHMGTGTVALCTTDPVWWAQTLMPHHPVEAYFHTPLE